MMDAFLLFIIAALSGFVLGHLFSWHALVVCGPVLAAISAIILQVHSFSFLPEIAIIVGSLSLNQIGYLVGARFRIGRNSGNAISAKSDTRHSR
jgi:hypothetical protein